MNVQNDILQDTELARVPQLLAGHAVPAVLEAREQAFARFAEEGFPGRRDEEWKYTDVSLLKKRATLSPDTIPPDPTSEAALIAWALAEEGQHLMVFVNGHYDEELSSRGDLPDAVHLLSLADVLESGRDLPDMFFDPLRERSVFAALNTALATDGAVLLLPPGAVIEKPIYLLFIASGHSGAAYPRNIVVAGEGARASIVEHYMGNVEAHSFTDALTQIRLAAGAEVRHYKLLQEGAAAAHIAGIHADQMAGSRFESYSFALGGHLGRNDITARLLEEGSHCEFHGLYLLDDKQHMDHHTRIDHMAPGCVSREFYRGVLDGESSGVFSGKVVVHEGAARTDASQSNHNLLLSPKAEVDTRPQLEIFADDVSCTHGATVGQLDEDSLFYLRSRGIDGEMARSLLIYGFAHSIIEKVAYPELRERINRLMLDRLAQGEAIKELL